jgi:hypothetical protein
MIEGLTATWVTDTDALKEIELRQTPTDATGSEDEAEHQTQQDLLVLTVVLVVGPPDPNALSYLVPRSVFERGLPVHVGALSAPEADRENTAQENTAQENTDQVLLDAMLDILEVMNPHDIVVFICDTQDTLEAALTLMAPSEH